MKDTRSLMLLLSPPPLRTIGIFPREILCRREVCSKVASPRNQNRKCLSWKGECPPVLITLIFSFFIAEGSNLHRYLGKSSEQKRSIAKRCEKMSRPIEKRKSSGTTLTSANAKSVIAKNTAILNNDHVPTIKANTDCYSKACLRSAMMSLTDSIPTDRRRRLGVMPVASCSASVSIT